MTSSPESEFTKIRLKSIEAVRVESVGRLGEEFVPFRSYLARGNALEEFVELTSISYTLAQQLLFSTPQDQLADARAADLSFSDLSFGLGDVNVESSVLASGWLSYEKYAEHEGITEEEVRLRAERGELGPIRSHPTRGMPVILWPPEHKRSEDFEVPGLGRSIYTVEVNVNAMVDDKENFDLSDPEQLAQARVHYLNLAHAIGNADEGSARAEEVLYRAAFLLQWASFETFLREIVEHLLTQHPQAIVQSAGRKTSLSYEQIFTMSSQLTSADDLRHELIELEIQKLRAGGRSVHGLINFLKSAFRFQNDPYTAPYVWKGEHREATYDTLLAIKERRNALTHELRVPQDEANGVMQEVNKDEYRNATLALRSVAYTIARDIHEKRYEIPSQSQS